MKRIFSLILNLLFVGAVIGVPLSTHYCQGKIVGSQWYGSFTDKPCQCSGDECGEGNCCNDTHQYLQIDCDLNTTSLTTFTLNIFNKIDLPAFVYHWTFDNVVEVDGFHKLPFYDLTLLPQGRSISILHQVFRL